MEMDRAKFLFFGAAVSFITALWNAAEVTKGNKDSAELMYVGMVGLAFFGYKIYKFGKK